MKLSVIIPMLNEADYVRAAIESAWDAGADEVIVVDGGSRDGCVTDARDAGATVFNGVRGRGVQLNLGAAAARGEVLLFLHADNRLGPGSGQQIREALADGTVLGGSFRQAIEAPGWMYRLLERGNAARVRWLGLPYGDQAIFLRRETFEQLGGFPEVPLMEDLLLMKQFRRLAPPVLLPGPLFVSARRWRQNGVLRQTLRNWSLLAARRLGISPRRLARFYR